MIREEAKTTHGSARTSTGALLIQLLLVGALMSGCSDAPAVPAGQVCAKTTAVSVPGTGACPQTRFVGRLAAPGVCPAALDTAKWDRQKLFRAPPPGITVPPQLKRYCLYTWKLTTPPVINDLGLLPPRGTLAWHQWLEPDCRVSVAAAGPGAVKSGAARQAVLAELRGAFRRQVEALPLALPPMGTTTPPVTVMVVDSWPKASSPTTAPGQFSHGVALAGVVQGLTCPFGGGGTCAAHIDRTLALNLEEDGRANETEGGFYGFQGRLARSIFDAWVQWKKLRPASKLIINLSLGWDGQFGSTTEPANAVHDVIRYISCNGGLVLAAAGNNSFGPTPNSGPIFPAAWATEFLPSLSSCPSGAGGGVPMLHAVGGVDGRDKPLLNARPGARPVLAAPGFYVAGEYQSGSTLLTTPPRSGSSMATAVVSAAAALAWAYQPGASAQDVIKTVTSAGVKLDSGADFCAAASCPKIRRVSICRTVEAATGSTLSACTRVAKGAGSNPTWSRATHAYIRGAGVDPYFANLHKRKATPRRCSYPVYLHTILPPFPFEPCPAERYATANLSPWASPQPSFPLCDPCGLEVNDPLIPRLLIGIRADSDGMAYPTQVAIFDADGYLLEAQYIGDAFLSGVDPGTVIEVELNPFGVANPELAAIEFMDDPHAPSEMIHEEIPLIY